MSRDKRLDNLQVQVSFSWEDACKGLTNDFSVAEVIDGMPAEFQMTLKATLVCSALDGLLMLAIDRLWEQEGPISEDDLIERLRTKWRNRDTEGVLWDDLDPESHDALFGVFIRAVDSTVSAWTYGDIDDGIIESMILYESRELLEDTEERIDDRKRRSEGKR